MGKRKSGAQTAPTEIEYVPPSAEKVDKYVQAVCRTLGEIDPIYNTREARDDLRQFLQVAADIEIARLNKRPKNNLDKPSAPE